ncbi:MAG: hypothetical protein JNK02_09610 [Planctomycetes bacterium]|nr:hypothetical protein [Planctomycetota bacterium]
MSKATTETAGAIPAASGASGAAAGPLARRLVRRELARAALDLARLPGRTGSYLLERDAARAELARALASHADPTPAPTFEPPRGRALSLFVSCAEASGEIHAANAVRALRELLGARGAPAPRLAGLGGARLESAGVELVADVVHDARMGFGAVLSALPRYLRVLEHAATRLERERPDVLLAVDSPALHVPLGRIARALGVPVVHFVAPQYWGWAPWRAAHYAQAVDLALTILPFEPAWFAARGVHVAHVGHPLLDELAGVERGDPERGTELVLLPGSRPGVVRRNLPWMLRAVAPLARSGAIPRVVVPAARPETTALVRAEVARAGAADFARVAPGELHESLRRARAAFSVSGTVLLDLLHHELPTVVVYRLGSRFAAEGQGHLLTAPWFASVNLLANREVLPEFSFAGEGPIERVRAALQAQWSDARVRARCRSGLVEARARLGPAGAVGRAASHALATACARARGGRA